MERIPSTPAVQPGTDHPFRVPESRQQQKQKGREEEPPGDTLELHDEEIPVETETPGTSEGSRIDFRA